MGSFGSHKFRKSSAKRRAAKKKLVQCNTPANPNSIIDKRKERGKKRRINQVKKSFITKTFMLIEYNNHAFLFKSLKLNSSKESKVSLIGIEGFGIPVFNKYNEMFSKYIKNPTSLSLDFFHTSGLSITKNKKQVYEQLLKTRFKHGGMEKLMAMVAPLSDKKDGDFEISDKLNFKYDLVYIKSNDGNFYIGETNLKPIPEDKSNYKVVLKNLLRIHVSKKKYREADNDYVKKPAKRISYNFMKRKKVNMAGSYVVSGIDDIIKEFIFIPGYSGLVDKLWDVYLLKDDIVKGKSDVSQISGDFKYNGFTQNEEYKVSNAVSNDYYESLSCQSKPKKNNSDEIHIVVPKSPMVAGSYKSNSGFGKSKKGSGVGVKKRSLKDI